MKMKGVRSSNMAARVYSATRCYIPKDITKLCRQQAEVIQNHDNENVRTIGQGEARHRKYKRLKLGGGQAYDRSSDWTAVVAKATKIGHHLLY
jgi:hypothetical protein